MSTKLNSAEINMLKSQMQMFGQFGGNNMGMNGLSQKIISVFLEAEASGEYSGEQIVQSMVQNPSFWETIINKSEYFISKLLPSGESQAAQREVKDEEKTIEDIENKIKQSGYKIKISLNEFENNSLSQQQKIEKATQALEERNEIIEKEQQEVDKIIQQINEKQQALAAASNDPETARSILGEIQGLSGELAGHLAVIDAVKAEIAKLSEISADAFDEMEEFKNKANEDISEEVATTQAAANEEMSQAANVATTSATGASNEARGVAFKTAAVAAETNVFTAPTAIKLEQAAADQHSAGATRISGAMSNFRMLQQGIGSLTSNTQLLSSFSNAIGMRESRFSNMIGSFNSILEPSITSLGSFDALGSITADLDNAVALDLAQLDSPEATENADVVENTIGYEKSKSYEDPSEPLLFEEDQPTRNSEAEFEFETPKVKVTL